MTTFGLVLPQKMEVEKATQSPTYAKFTVEPLERGYGHTVGHALRRILLSSLEGAAVSAVRVKGAPHEFSSLKGMKEDVIHLILNLRQMRLKLHSAGPETLVLKTKKAGTVKVKDIEEHSEITLLNPDLALATLEAGADLDVEIEVSRGRGYVSAERLKKEGQPVGTLPVDALFSPVPKVHYEVENARVGQMTDYDKLILEVWTDGSLSPAEALSSAALILQQSLAVFLPVVSGSPLASSGDAVEPPANVKDLMQQPVEMIELSVRASNCLKAAKIRTIGDLVTKSEEELMGFKNFGNKSLDEIKDRLKEMELSLGMKALAR